MSIKSILFIICNSILDNITEKVMNHRRLFSIFKHRKYISNLIQKSIYNRDKKENKAFRKHCNIKYIDGKKVLFHKNPIKGIKLPINILLTEKTLGFNQLLVNKFNKVKDLCINVSLLYDIAPYNYYRDGTIIQHHISYYNPFYDAFANVTLTIPLDKVIYSIYVNKVIIVYIYNGVEYAIIINNLSLKDFKKLFENKQIIMLDVISTFMNTDVLIANYITLTHHN